MSNKCGDMLILDILCDKLISELYELRSSIVSYKSSLTNLNEYAKNRELLVELFDSSKIDVKRLKYIKKNLVSLILIDNTQFYHRNISYLLENLRCRYFNVFCYLKKDLRKVLMKIFSWKRYSNFDRFSPRYPLEYTRNTVVPMN